MNAMMTLNQMLGGALRVWLEVALLAGLLVALLFRPERIRSLSTLQLAAVLFALSIIVPSVLPLFADSSGTTARGGASGAFGSPAGQTDLLSKMALALGPTLFGLSIAAALLGLMPAANANGGKSAKSSQSELVVVK